MQSSRLWKKVIKLGFIAFMMIGVLSLSQLSAYAAPAVSTVHPSTNRWL